MGMLLSFQCLQSVQHWSCSGTSIGSTTCKTLELELIQNTLHHILLKVQAIIVSKLNYADFNQELLSLDAVQFLDSKHCSQSHQLF